MSIFVLRLLLILLPLIIFAWWLYARRRARDDEAFTAVAQQRLIYTILAVALALLAFAAIEVFFGDHQTTEYLRWSAEQQPPEPRP